MNIRQPSPGFEARVRDGFERQPFMRFIGAQLVSISPGRVELLLERRPELTQQMGFFHGGAVATMADVAGGFAALTLFEPASEILTVEFKVNLLAPAVGDRIIATGEVFKSGRTLTVCGMKVHSHHGDTATLCAVAQQTLMQIARSPE
jgi:uncharacterized protein (TIGR00369 family)